MFICYNTDQALSTVVHFRRLLFPIHGRSTLYEYALRRQGHQRPRTTVLCETQMLQIVTLHGDYLYQMAPLGIIISTEGATWFINFEVPGIKYFMLKTADNKIAKTRLIDKWMHLISRSLLILLSAIGVASKPLRLCMRSTLWHKF